MKYLILSNSNDLVRVSPERIVYVSSDGNYSTMVLTTAEEHLFTINLGTMERMIEEQLEADARLFIRLGKSLIINSSYIYYINVSRQQLVLSDMRFAERFTLSASKEALKALKSVLEDSLNSRRTEK
ncbi:LytTR family DNA-binding domain-containing protein [Dysgonomonas macrotermitis]|uniref:Transcriptional regulator, LytTR family n=1 Tax=Dysgonomonas macrotermitis TaxID=1346286 RepID=A0A1M4ZC01_9BACT|nr:LytTR family DNA-binding domain-containing protein [Dysgonomonas macrotermitis]SHF15126.1 transcriptional regulator, LytTR family [Dysgonomonas macrotermitis]